MLKRLIENIAAKKFPAPNRDDIREEVERQNEELGKLVATRYSRGNVAIQRGAMTLKSDLGAPGAKRPKRSK